MALSNQLTSEESSEKPVEKPLVMPPPVQSAPIPQPKPYIASARAETVFGSGVTIEGEIEGDSNVRIAGKFNGDIKIEADLNIEKGAHLGAKIHAANVTIAGEVEGNVISTRQVKLLESGQLIGNLNAKTLTVAPGSRMRGHVEFGWSASEAATFFLSDRARAALREREADGDAKPADATVAIMSDQKLQNAPHDQPVDKTQYKYREEGRVKPTATKA